MSREGLPLALGAALLSWLLTGAALRFAVRKSLMDIPGRRSSHTRPTPRGGGLAIDFTTLSGFLVLGWTGQLAWTIIWGLLGAGALVSLIGFADDLGEIGVGWRLVAHFVAAAWLLAWLGGLPPLPVLGVVRDLGWFGNVLAALYLAWLINLTNFMDGIDGIASVEVITVCLGGVVAGRVVAPATSQWAPAAVLASATLGFLGWNWPPAKIFMGDAGSGFVGLMLGALSLQAGLEAPMLFWAWVILLGVFVVDATATLTIRVTRGQKVYQAHRSHAYQHAARRWGSHRSVTVAVGLINLCWLLPLALLVASRVLSESAGLLIAYAPLVAIALLLRAGNPAEA